MKFSAAITATLAPVVLAKSAASKFPVMKRDVIVEANPRPAAPAAALAGAIAGALQSVQKNVIIVLWQFPGGPAATTNSIDKTLTITQTVTVPNKGVAEATSTSASEKKNDAATTSASTTAQTTSKASGTGAVAGAGTTHTVTVGGAQGLSYFPESINAAVGDVVQFEFLAQNHTVTQSTFDEPCKPLAGGMNSGFMPNPNNTVTPNPAMAMQVMTSDPLWMYCAQANHCGHGMVFSINPTAAKTHAQFQARAINSTGKGLTGSALTGGSGSANLPAAASSGTSSTATATTVSAPSSVQTGIATGTGTLQADGSCLCSVQCASGSFPVADMGVGSFGGSAGSMNMAEAAGVLPSTRRRRHFW